MISVDCTHIREFKIYTVSTDRESKLSESCTVKHNHKALVYIRVLYPAAHLYT
jgi:hypothetical protein